MPEVTAGLRERLEAARSLADTLDARGNRSMDSDLCAAAGLLRLLAENLADRDRLAAEVAELEKRLARSQQSRRNLRGLLEHHRDMGSLGMLRQHRNRLSRALRACARYRTDLAQLRTALSRALDLLGREHHAESSYTAQGIAVLREAHDNAGEA